MAPPDGVGRRIREWVPGWWRGEGGAVGRAMDLLLWPAEGLFRVGIGARARAFEAGVLRSQRAPIPVVSIGNIAVGGAGKTPFSAWVAGRLVEWGRRPALVLRGYGVDEMLVHRELNPGVPVFAAARRIDGVREAAAEGCDVAVLDDAFQHRRIERDLDLVLLAADGWTGRIRLLPRGGWREGLAALDRANLVVVTRKAASEEAAREVERAAAAVVSKDRVVRCRIALTGLVALGEGDGAVPAAPLEALRDRQIVAVTSLADPRAFVSQLEAAGARVELISFPDHHTFTPLDVAGLVERSGERAIVMTRKEAVKLRGMLPPELEAWVVDQRVIMESNGEALDEALRRAVG